MKLCFKILCLRREAELLIILSQAGAWDRDENELSIINLDKIIR
jgi:hypothetical protein